MKNVYLFRDGKSDERIWASHNKIWRQQTRNHTDRWKKKKKKKKLKLNIYEYI